MKINWENKKTLIIIALIVVGIISLIIGFNHDIAFMINAKNIQYLDTQKENVEKFTLALIGTSLLINAIPGDFGNSIATQLAGFSKYSLVVLCGIFLEKYILTINTFIFFGIAIPISCIFIIIYLVKNYINFKVYAIKIITIALAFFLVIPTSIKVSKLFEQTFAESYKQIELTNAEIQAEKEKIEQAEKEKAELEAKEEAQKEENINKSFISGISSWFGNITNSASNTISNIADSIKTSGQKIVDKGKHELKKAIEGFALMIITSCLIPIGVFFVFKMLIQIFFNRKINLPYEKKLKNQLKIK